jgi:hypothetical protein
MDTATGYTWSPLTWEDIAHEVGSVPVVALVSPEHEPDEERDSERVEEDEEDGKGTHAVKGVDGDRGNMVGSGRDD